MKVTIKKQDNVLPNVSPIVSAILQNRGVTDANSFIKADIRNLRDPKLLKEAEWAAHLIQKAINNGEQITVIGDYDCDGLTSTALVVWILRKLDANINYHINSRFNEGYGIKPETIETLDREGTKTIITVDNGITAYEAAQKAADLDLAMIITDHHDPGEDLPNAVAIVNPKQKGCAYPFKGLSGCGVAFKVMQLVCALYGRSKLALRALDFVALATVADVVPLLDENRIMVKNGLKLFNWEHARPAFKAMRLASGLKTEVNSYALGFIFGPMLNAQGRLTDNPEACVSLLLEENYEKALDMAQSLTALNKERQSLTASITADATLHADTSQKVIVVHGDDYHEGVIGIVAGRLKELFQRPVIVLSGKGELKGSGRSPEIDNFNLREALEKCQESLIAFGGHQCAAGLSLSEDKLPEFIEAIQAEATHLIGMNEGVVVDALIQESDITAELVDELKSLEPFGMGFPQPVLGFIKDVTSQPLYFGNEGSHIKFPGPPEIIIWRAREQFEALSPKTVLVLGTCTQNTFGGNAQMISNVWFPYRGEGCLVKEQIRLF